MLNPKISIITVCFNASQTIPSTIDSILLQDYTNAEHIIVDGKSSDDTLALIHLKEKDYNLKGYTLKVISQSDKGIYDAMNKGIKLASGEIIGFLNADDFYANSGVLSLIAWGFSKPTKPSIVYADICYVSKNGKVARTMLGESQKRANFALGFHPPHPSFYAKRELFSSYGEFDLRYSISADYDLMLRFLYKYKCESLYIDEIFVKMNLGGVSNKSVKNILKANLQCLQSARENGIRFSLLAIVCKVLSKLKSINYKLLVKSPPPQRVSRDAYLDSVIFIEFIESKFFIPSQAFLKPSFYEPFCKASFCSLPHTSEDLYFIEDSSLEAA